MASKMSQRYSSLWSSCDELRGGMEASQYKDYVLFMLFIKYISDKYGNSDDFAPPVAILMGASFIDMLKHFGGEDYPLGRKRYTKLSYMLYRHVEREADDYLKKAAGPYNRQTNYGCSEKIAQAEGYFEKWYGPEAIQWLAQFRYKKNDELEVLATVDMAAHELWAFGKSVDVSSVKDVIASHSEWEAKMDRAAFSDANIAEAIKQSNALLGSEIAGVSHA